MFKFVVLCAFVASVVAEADPGALIAPYIQPYAAYSTVVSPGLTSYSSHSSSVIHPSAVTYSSPLAFSHFIKKRSAQLLATPFNTAYGYPYSTYSYSSTPFLSSAPIVQAPIAYSSGHLPLTAHLIKKRSAALQYTPYFAQSSYLANPAFSAPLISTPYLQTPYYSSQLPLVNAHFIKKRSAEPSADPQTFYSSSYLTPSTFIKTIPTTPYYTNPLIQSYYSPQVLPFAATHLIKKRSADPAPEPAAEPAADPQLLAYPSYPSTYYGGPTFVPTYPSATLIKSSPIITTNPFVYSTFIKK